jgi:hypothetical protein
MSEGIRGGFTYRARPARRLVDRALFLAPSFREAVDRGPLDRVRRAEGPGDGLPRASVGGAGARASPAPREGPAAASRSPLRTPRNRSFTRWRAAPCGARIVIELRGGPRGSLGRQEAEKRLGIPRGISKAAGPDRRGERRSGPLPFPGRRRALGSGRGAPASAPDGPVAQAGDSGPCCQSPRWSAPSSVTTTMSSQRTPNSPGR